MIKSFFYQVGEGVKVIEDVANFDKLMATPDSLLWVDMCKPNDKELFILTHDFHFHPLAIEDVISERPRTKIDDYDKYLFLVFQAADFIGREHGLKVTEVDFFLGKNSLVTVHYDEHRLFDHLYYRAERDERLISRGADFLLHTVIDAIVDNYNSTLDIFEYEVDRVEDDVLSEPDEETVKSIFTLRRDIVQLKRIVLPQKEVIGRLSHPGWDLVSDKATVYFADIHDHLISINDLADSHREILNSSLEAYYSSIHTKTNEIIKFLTIFTGLFIPPTFLVGIWGMNFDFMPELNQPWGYWAALSFIGLVIGSLLLFFHKKKWL